MTLTYKPARIRAAGGRRIAPGGAVYPQTPAMIGTGCGRMDSTVSMVGPPWVSQNQWDVKEQKARCGRCNVTTGLGRYENWRLDVGFSYNETPSVVSFTFYSDPAFDVNLWKTKALAQTYFPSTTIDPYLFIYEAREIPMMLYEAYRILSGRASVSDIVDVQLALNFGWGPLYRDLRTLVDLGLYVARVHEALASTIERVQEGLGTYTGQQTITAGTGISSVTHSLTLEHKTKVWFQSRWVPDPVPKLATDKIRAFHAAMSNLHSTALTVWNALPWSFLIDYFLNISTVLEAAAGITYRADKLLIMAETVTETQRYIPPAIAGLQLVSEPSYWGRQRRRFVFSHPTPSLGFKPYPWLNKGGIMSLLAVAQLQRK